jgi:hypothetical protein
VNLDDHLGRQDFAQSSFEIRNHRR